MLKTLVIGAVLGVLDKNNVPFFISRDRIVCNDSVENHKQSFDTALHVKGTVEGTKYVWFVPFGHPLDPDGIKVTLDSESDTFDFEVVK
jgi:hypothetical protein